MFYKARISKRRVWRYQRGNQNPHIEEEQTTQWPKEKVEMDKQRSTKHTYKTKDRVTRTPLKTGGELRCSGRVGSKFALKVKYTILSIVLARLGTKWAIFLENHPLMLNSQFHFIWSSVFIEEYVDVNS